MSESEPLERAQNAIDEARSAAADALPGQELSAPPGGDGSTGTQRPDTREGGVEDGVGDEVEASGEAEEADDSQDDKPDDHTNDEDAPAKAGD